jgi:Tfp pilus assembly protein PilZ
MVSAAAEKVLPARRSRRRLTVHYGTGSTKHIGYSGNISRTGMMIRTTRVFEPGTILTLEVELLPRTICLTGKVMWARVGELRWLPTGKIGMGIRFIDPPENLMETIAPIAASA